MEPSHGRFEVEKFDGKKDFGLSKRKILTWLEVFGLNEVLERDSKETMEYTIKEDNEIDLKLNTTKDEKDGSIKDLQIMHLGDEVLRNVMNEPTGAKMWSVLEKCTSLNHYLKQCFYNFIQATFVQLQDRWSQLNIWEYICFLKLVYNLAKC